MEIFDYVINFLKKNNNIIKNNPTEIYNLMLEGKTVTWDDTCLILDTIKSWKKHPSLFEEV